MSGWDDARPTRRGASRARAALVGVGVAGALLAAAVVSAPEFIAARSPEGIPAAAAPRSDVDERAGQTSPPRPDRDPVAEQAARRTAAVTGLLEQRTDAVRTGDRTAWLATLDPSSAEFVAAQDLLFTTLGQLPTASWTYTYAGEGTSLPPQRLAELGTDAFVADVRLSYRLEGYDAHEVLRDQRLTVVRRDGQWLLASDGDGAAAPGAAPGAARQLDVWDLGAVEVVHGASSLVLVRSGPQRSASQDAALAVAGQADRAVEAVRRSWGEDWSRRVVVVIPGSLEEMAQLLAADTVGLDQVAAVTTGQVGRPGSGTTGDRIVVNPTSFPTLTAAGRQVVLTHETVHVATRAVTSGDVPIWLSEGYADHAAYRDTGFSPQDVARDALAEVRAGALPRRFPAEEDFDPTRGPVAASYSKSWLLVRMLVRTYGEQRVVELYRAIAAGEPGDPAASRSAAFRDVLGTTEEGILATWQQELAVLAERSGG